MTDSIQATKQNRICKKWSEGEALEEIGQLLNKTCGVSPQIITTDSRLVDDLNVDSLGMLEAIIEAEDVFDVSIDAGELSPSLTIGGLIAILAGKGVIH